MGGNIKEVRIFRDASIKYIFTIFMHYIYDENR